MFNPAINVAKDPVSDEMLQQAGKDISQQLVKEDVLTAWQQEAASIDRSVRILPSVKEMIASIPEGRYAVATSGAKIYGKLIIIFRHCRAIPNVIVLTSVWLHDTCWYHTS